jgi:hypothetical protein
VEGMMLRSVVTTPMAQHLGFPAHHLIQVNVRARATRTRGGPEFHTMRAIRRSLIGSWIGLN